jgi:hypothetical protein
MEAGKGKKIDFDDLTDRRTTMKTRFDSLAPLRIEKNSGASESNGPDTERPTRRQFIVEKGST